MMSKLLSIGIDCGSTACKAAVFDGTKILHTTVVPTGWNPRETGLQLYQSLLDQYQISQEKSVCTVTGYGRVNMDFASYSLSEITCHGIGGHYLLPGVQTIIDIGGQDCKVMELSHGQVLDFQMNDRCAAGTGRFVEMAIHRLGISLDSLNNIDDDIEECKITSMCAVFAESEIISALAGGYSRESILSGVLTSVCQRVAVLTGKLTISDPVLLTGGLATSTKLLKVLSDTLHVEVQSSPLSQLAGAIGASIHGFSKQK